MTWSATTTASHRHDRRGDDGGATGAGPRPFDILALLRCHEIVTAAARRSEGERRERGGGERGGGEQRAAHVARAQRRVIFFSVVIAVVGGAARDLTSRRTAGRYTKQPSYTMAGMCSNRRERASSAPRRATTVLAAVRSL